MATMFELDTLHNRPATYDDESSHTSSDSSNDLDGEAVEERAIYLLGQKHDETSLREFQKKLYWMTYRKELQVGLRPYGGGGKFIGVTTDSNTSNGGVSDFGVEGANLETLEELASCGLRTDAGWGCMLRSAQMMLAQTVRLHFSASASNVGRFCKRDASEEMRIAAWFADFPNPDLTDSSDDHINESNPQLDSNTSAKEDDDRIDYHHWYSLHQMVAAGLGLGMLPGEWYGPTTVTHVLRELNEMHCDYLEKRVRQNNHSTGKAMFRIHVATEGCIYLDAVANLMTKNQVSEQSADKALPLDDPLQITNSTNSKKQEWDTSLLLLLPLRLGIQSIPTETYGAPLAKLIQFSQSVGMLGGTPRHALWFYGAEDVALTAAKDAVRVGGWYGLDPHTTQPAPRGVLEEIGTNSNTKKYRWKVNMNESYLRSLHIGAVSHSNHEKSIPLSNIDPTLALGFYFKDYQDFNSFKRSLHSLNAECKRNNLPSILTILENAPNYEVDVGEVMKNMALNKKNALEDDVDGFSLKSEDGELEDDDDNDDDYVLV